MRVKSIFTYLITGLIFLTPSNLFYKLVESTAYSQGLLIDYLIPKIYLSDLLIFAILGLGLIAAIRRKLRVGGRYLECWHNQLRRVWSQLSQWRWPLLLLMILALRQIFTPHPIVALWSLIKIILFIVVAIMVKSKLQTLNKSQPLRLQLIIVITLVFQALLCLFQSYYQKPLLGYLFLGEPNIAQPAGIAHYVSYSGEQRILPYGTTVHPNVLAGTAVIFLWLIFQLASNKKKTDKTSLIIKLIAVQATLIILVLAQSWTAWITLLWLILLAILKGSFSRVYKKFGVNKVLIIYSLVSLLFIPVVIWAVSLSQPNNLSMIRRVWLNKEAFIIFGKQPLLGIGLNQFTTKLPANGQGMVGPAFIQPAHNVGWLYLAETGLLGVTVLATVFQKMNQKNQIDVLKLITPLLIIASLDHYLLTTQTGWLLVVWIYAFSRKK